MANVVTPPIEVRTHPSGAAGAKVSLEQMSDRIRKDYIDPLVVSFARRVLNDRRDATTTRAKIQALLDAMKARARYILDPTNSEYIASARLILCLDSTQKDYCHAGGDCEELTATLCALLMAVGIDCKIIGQGFSSGSNVPTHVLMAAFDPSSETWIRVDPSTNLPVGKSHPATSEVEIDPLTGITPDFSEPAPAASFVGVGMVPVRFASGALGYVPASALAPSGQLAAAGPFAQAQSDLNVMVATIQAGDSALKSGQYAYAVQVYQAAGNVGATIVGPDIDLGGAPNTTQPITQQAWLLNGRLASGLWLINGQLVPLASSNTYEASAAAAAAVRQMVTYYQQAIAAGTAALQTPPPFPGPTTSTNTIAAWAIGLGVVAGLGWAVWRSRREHAPAPERLDRRHHVDQTAEGWT